MLVLGIPGSLRQCSLNTALLRTAAERLPAGTALELYARLAEIPPFNEDAERLPAPEAVRDLREAIRAADAVLLATPEYNHSLPGQLKNALDWASRPAGRSSLAGKPVAVIGASTSMFGGVWAQAELRKVLAAMGGRVIDLDLPVAHAHMLRSGGRLELKQAQSERLDEILGKLAEPLREAEEPLAA